MRAHFPAAAGIFAVAFTVRWWLRQGLVLGDDPQEYAVLLHILTHGPLLHDQLHLRFAGWIFNHLAFWLGGVNEAMFLLPTALVTSTFGVLAYAILDRWGYDRWRAFLGGLLVALAPFEVVLGSLRANDSYLEFAVAAGFASLVLLERRPVWQGIAVAFWVWFGFYVKMFVVYTLPAIGLYWLVGRRWRSLASFVGASVVLHGIACVYWKSQVGTFFPFFSQYAANYPVPRADLVDLFLKYPRLMFVGSFEFPTTLWGAGPYVLVILLAVKLVATFVRSAPACLRFDRADRMLLALWGSFFLLLEFFPNGFKLDAYYSVPRIFRYLAPISFPIALHAAKLVLDLTRLPVASVPSNAVATAVVVPLLAIYVAQAAEANAPSSLYRATFHEVLQDLRTQKPRHLVAESVVASYLRDLYLDPDEQETQVTILRTEHNATEYEKWLRANEAKLPNGTYLITGLASFIHYGAHIDGFRLAWFEQPLSPQWKLVREYAVQTYLPRPEAARLWRLDRPEPRPEAVAHDEREDLSPVRAIDDPPTLLRDGMALYDQGKYRDARLYLAKLRTLAHPEAENGAFFYAATFFRQGDYPRARHEFKRLIRRYPTGRWTPAAYWHVAQCEKILGRVVRARRLFAMVVRRFPNDPSTTQMAKRELAGFEKRREGAIAKWWRTL